MDIGQAIEEARNELGPGATNDEIMNLAYAFNPDLRDDEELLAHFAEELENRNAYL